MTKIKQYICTMVLVAIFGVTNLSAQNHRVYPNYMSNTLQKGLKLSGFKGQDTIKHFFLEFSGGPTFSFTQGGDKRLQAPGYEFGIAFGHWFTPINGARIGVFGKRYNSTPLGEAIKANNLGVSMDYLANFSALGNDYNALRKFEMFGILGGEYLFSKYEGTNYTTWGIRTGLQARYAWDYGTVFYWEPRIGLYTDNMDYTSSWRKFNVAGSILVGVEFRNYPKGLRRTHKFSSTKFKDHSFLYTGIGFGSLITKETTNLSRYSGGGVLLGIGRWFNRYSGARLTGKITTFDHPKSEDKIRSIGFQADYMLNLSSAFYGYNPDKRFELLAIAGFSYDSVSNTQKTNLFGLGAGLQASVKLTRDMSLFVEPRINFYPGKEYASGANGEDKCRANFLINAGITITSNPSETTSSNEPGTKNRFKPGFFIEGAYGLTTPIEEASLYQKNVNPRITGTVGRNFSKTFGVRLSADFGKLWKSNDLPDVNTSTFGVDALWNISSYMSGYDPERIFELIGTAGPNLAFRSSQPGNKAYLGGKCSFQGLWKITPSLGVYIEPQLRLYPDTFSEGSISLGNLDGVVNVMAGLRINL